MIRRESEIATTPNGAEQCTRTIAAELVPAEKCGTTVDTLQPIQRACMSVAIEPARYPSQSDARGAALKNA